MDWAGAAENAGALLVTGRGGWCRGGGLGATCADRLMLAWPATAGGQGVELSGWRQAPRALVGPAALEWRTAGP